MNSRDKKAEGLILHCSDSDFGCATMIKTWHTSPKPVGRGWRDIGYHLVITNGIWNLRMLKEKQVWPFADGTVEAGRPFDTEAKMEIDEIGAHCYGWNGRTIGVCLVGKKGQYSIHQLHNLRNVINNYLMPMMGWNVDDIRGHCEYDPKKTCPDINMDLFREFLLKESVLDDLLVEMRHRNNLAGEREII